MGAVAKFEGMAGKQRLGDQLLLPLRRLLDVAPAPSTSSPQAEMESIRAHGSIPFFSWASQSTPASLNQPDFQLADVIAGNHDAYIREFAEAATRLGPPLLPPLQLGDERRLVPLGEGVNGNQPGEYVAAWRHVHDIFTRGRRRPTRPGSGAPTSTPTNELQDLASLYPGDEYVDWTGLDGYNWGTNPAQPDRWRSFDDLFSSTYDEITEHDRPRQAADRSARSARPSTAARRRAGSPTR